MLFPVHGANVLFYTPGTITQFYENITSFTLSILIQMLVYQIQQSHAVYGF